MKLSVAAIVLSHSLPTWSEVPVHTERSLSGVLPRTMQSTADILRAAQEKRLAAAKLRLAFHFKGLTNGPRILKSNVHCDPSSTDPDIGILSCGEDRMCQTRLGSQFGGICVPKSNAHKASHTGRTFMKSRPKFTRNGRLTNHDVAGNLVPCDPTAPVDIGILACGQDEFCQLDKNSELGGFCSRAPVTSRRLDTVGICDTTSPDFISSCNCTGLDNTTGTGVVDCLLYENYPIPATSSECEGINVTVAVSYTFKDSVATSFNACYAMNTPSYQKVCYSYSYLASDGSCSLTFNGQPCTTCTSGNSPYYDCSNVEGGIAAESTIELIPTVGECLLSNLTYSSNCTLCSAGDYIAYANYGTNVTIPGVGELPCGYLALAEIFALIPSEYCSIFSAAAQSGCCAYQCDLCGPTAYIPPDKFDTQLNVTVPGYEGVTCGSINNAAKLNFTIPDGTCNSIGKLIQPTCCNKIPDECSLCDGPLTNPDVNVTIEGYSVQCATLEALLSPLECASVSDVVSPVCCSGSPSSPVETPTAAPGSPSAPGESPSGSGGEESSDATRIMLTRGGLVSSVVGVMIAAVMLVASS